MQFVAYPLKGVNDIEFGMTAKMVKEKMSGELEIGDIRATSKDHPTYSYPNEPVFFYFDGDGHLDSIEFCHGADVLIGGVNILDMPVQTAIGAMLKLDPNAIVDDDSVVSPELSIAIWCPHLGDPEDEEPVETILIGKPGYYDDLQANDAPTR